MKKLSFILPVYKVEPYVEKCIRSIRDENMPLDDYEIIVVNDGSPDNSEAIVRQLQQVIPNIILLNQENAGVAAARNRGISVAKGEYIVFVDPDDFLVPNLLAKLFNRAKQERLDILLSGRSIVKFNGEIIHKVGYQLQEGKLYNGPEAFYEKDKPYPVFDTCWGRLYRRALIETYKINFPAGVSHLEDGVFVRKIFSVATRVGFDNSDFYQAFERPGSASRSNLSSSEKAAIGDLISVQNLSDFKAKNQFNSEQKGLMNTSIIKYTLLPLMRAYNAKNLSMLWRFHKRIKANGFRPLDTEFVNKGIYLNLAKTYNRSLILFVLRYLLKKKIQKFKAN